MLVYTYSAGLITKEESKIELIYDENGKITY